MGRFRWLEMDGRAPGGNGPLAAPGQPELDESACLARGDQLLRQGQYESALQWYSRALRYAIDLEEAWVGQVCCLLGLEENVEANIWADRGLERFPDSPDLLAAKAMALARTRGAATAMAYSDAALSVKGRPVGPYPWIVRGDLLLNNGAEENAQRCFQKAIEIAGGDWYTHYCVGLSFLRKRRPEEALLWFARGAELERRNPMLLCEIGRCYEESGETEAAIGAYRRAREADARCKVARERLTELEGIGPLRRAWRRLWRGR